MKILMYRWKAYTQFDIIENLCLRGHIVDDFDGEMENYEYDETFLKRLRTRLDATQYDMMFTANFFPMISDECEKRNIIYVSWCCDSPISTMYHKSVFNRNNRIFQFDKLNQLEFEAMGAPVYYLPLAGAAERVTKLLEETVRMNPDRMDRYRSDVAFVGSMYRKTSYDEIYEHMTDYQKGYFDAALKMQMNAYGIYLLDDALDATMMADFSRNFKLHKSAGSFADLKMTVATTALSFKIAQMERQSVIADLSKRYDVAIYTDDRETDFICARNCGTVDYWSEAPIVFSQSKINLNLTLRSIQSGVPQRVWDILSAGGFCITNYQQELGMYFEIGKDLVVFEDLYDLNKKVAYYLAHEDERNEIALHGFEKVRSLHQYQNRLDEMATIIKGL